MTDDTSVRRKQQRAINDMARIHVEYLDCHELQHQWRWPGRTLTKVDSDGLGVVLGQRVLVCRVCDLHRTDDIVLATGLVWRRRYSHYPPGYRTKGLGHIPRAEYRRLVVRAAWKATRRKK